MSRLILGRLELISISIVADLVGCFVGLSVVLCCAIGEDIGLGHR